MPTINKYKKDHKFYIRARPSNVGNITYKIEKKGNPIIRRHGLEHGDEISWSTIQSFKALGIIYTDQSGTIGPDDFEPDPQQLEKTKLTEPEAQGLFSIITEEFELSGRERAELRSILGLPPAMDMGMVGDQIESSLESLSGTGSIPVRGQNEVGDLEEIDISTHVEEDLSGSFDTWRLHVKIISEIDGIPRETDHCIHLCEDHGLENWHIQVSETPTWEIKRVAVLQKGLIITVLIQELQAVGFDLGDPSEVMPPYVQSVE